MLFYTPFSTRQWLTACTQLDIEAAKGKSLEALSPIDEATGFPILPQWLAQPYIRPLPKEPEAAQPPQESRKSGVEVVGVSPWTSVMDSFADPPAAMDCSVEDSATRGSKRPISEEPVVAAAQAEAVETKRPKLVADEDTVDPKRIDGEAAVG